MWKYQTILHFLRVFSVLVTHSLKINSWLFDPPCRAMQYLVAHHCETSVESVFNLNLAVLSHKFHSPDSTNRTTRIKKSKGSPYSITERRLPELIPVLGSQPAGDVSHKPGGRLPLLSARPAVTPATLKRAAINFAAWWTEAQFKCYVF